MREFLFVLVHVFGSVGWAYALPQIFADGAFSHRPFLVGAYGFPYSREKYVIPDQSGLYSGQESWVSIAECCAFTPKQSDSPMDDAEEEGTILTADLHAVS